MPGPTVGPAAGPILLNYRAATRPTITGVERWAGEVIPRLCAIDPSRYEIAAPRRRLRGRAAGQVWEQVGLPARAAGRRAALVLSPANLAPLAWPRNVVVMHDAAVLREPAAYSRTYRGWHGHLGVAAARRALAVVTVSEFSRGELVTLLGLDPARVQVVPGGVSSAFAPAAADRGVLDRLGLDRPYVLSIATADRRKNLGVLAAVAARLAPAGIELVHAGDRRPYFSASEGTGAVRSLGYLADADLPAVYAGALAFVLPSRYEGFGLTCLEAMACGTPVLAANRAALPETCGGAAELVDPDDPEGLAAAVLAVATEPQRAGRLRAAGLARAAGFSWDRTASALHALMRALP